MDEMTATALALREQRKREEAVRFVAKVRAAQHYPQLEWGELSAYAQRTYLNDARGAISAYEQWLSLCGKE